MSGYTHFIALVHPVPIASHRSRCVSIGARGLTVAAIITALVTLVASPVTPLREYVPSHTVRYSLPRLGSGKASGNPGHRTLAHPVTNFHPGTPLPSRMVLCLHYQTLYYATQRYMQNPLIHHWRSNSQHDHRTIATASTVNHY